MKKIQLKGVVGWDFFESTLSEQLPGNGEDVYLVVDSVGGSVFEGNRLYKVLESTSRSR